MKYTEVYVNTHTYVYTIIYVSLCYQKMGAVHIFKNRGMIKSDTCTQWNSI